MSHELEMIGNQASMAYVGEMPWHGLGIKVPADISTDEMLKAAGLNWTVEKVKAYSVIDHKVIPINRSALVRSTDRAILDVVSNDWVPVQNKEAFDFFNEFVEAGDMEVHTAGSLKGGQIVWCLVKIKNSFEIFGGDLTEGYLLFTNYHKYGHSTDIRVTMIRVVCANTIAMALNSATQNKFKYTHRNIFNPEHAKEMMGIASAKMKSYKETCEYLGSKKAKGEDLIEYFIRLFPSLKEGNLSRNGKVCLDKVDSQPGAKFAAGTWYQPYQAVTRFMDHDAGRSVDTRITSSWYGDHQKTKIKALNLALEMAKAS